jgi:hypothetical protein
MVWHPLASYSCGCGRIGRFKRAGPTLMSRCRCITAFALTCVATALAACGAVPREERSQRTTLSRTYPVAMQSLASCALERLGQKYGKIQRTDFPDRYMVTLGLEAEWGVTAWDTELVAVDQGNTRVTVVIPPKVGNVQADQILADVETCAAPPGSGPRVRG